MKYTEITVKCASEASELVADVMYVATNQSVAIYDKKDLDGLQFEYFEQSIADNMPNQCLVKAYCACADTNKCVSEIGQGYFDIFGTFPDYSVRVFDDKEYIDIWKQYFVPIAIGNIVVEPLWKASGRDNAVLIDTSMAFGTGQHATTAGCIEALQLLDCVGKRVLDVGCGSGILSICSAKLGASCVTALDYDTEAVTTTSRNIALNNVGDIVRAGQSDLLSQCDGIYDIVIANITTNILTLLYPQLSRVLAGEAFVILSGIADGQEKGMLDLYGQTLHLKEHLVKEGWHTLIFCTQ